jgi:hypothetical protein
MTIGNYNGFPTKELSTMYDDMCKKMGELEGCIVSFGEKLKEHGALDPHLEVHVNIETGYYSFHSDTPDDYWYEMDNVLEDLANPSSVNKDYKLFVGECEI